MSPLRIENYFGNAYPCASLYSANLLGSLTCGHGVFPGNDLSEFKIFGPFLISDSSSADYSNVWSCQSADCMDSKRTRIPH